MSKVTANSAGVEMLLDVFQSLEGVERSLGVGVSADKLLGVVVEKGDENLVEELDEALEHLGFECGELALSPSGDSYYPLFAREGA